ncbi:MAG: hypothetical protein QXG86_02635 [Candidatus Woesearchaeota archaeon]
MLPCLLNLTTTNNKNKNSICSNERRILLESLQKCIEDVFKNSISEGFYEVPKRMREAYSNYLIAHWNNSVREEDFSDLEIEALSYALSKGNELYSKFFLENKKNQNK